MSSGPGLLRKLKDAIAKRVDKVGSFEQMTSSVATWTAAIELWESDNKQVNLFVVTMKSAFAPSMGRVIPANILITAMNQHDVRLALAKVEAEDIANRTCQDLHASISPSMMISMGMEHKQAQYVYLFYKVLLILTTYHF